MTAVYSLQKQLLLGLCEPKVTLAGKKAALAGFRLCSVFSIRLPAKLMKYFKKPTPTDCVRPSAVILKYYTDRFVAFEIFSFIPDQMASASLRSPSLCFHSFPPAIVVIAVLKFITTTAVFPWLPLTL